MPDYSIIDHPELLVYVFYPRQSDTRFLPKYAYDIAIPVENDISVTCRFFKGDNSWPWLLYFHGNGEIANDYDEISPFFFKRKLNLVVADYRGYGSSTGEPTFTAITGDCHIILKAVREELVRQGQKADIWVMGRSLGSISALELAFHSRQEIRGIIIESGFISVVRVMRHLDTPIDDTRYNQIDAQCLDLVRSVNVPALIIHGENDTIVPYQEALDLYETIGSPQKEMLTIPAADHNDIMFVGLKQYFDAIVKFIETTAF